MGEETSPPDVEESTEPPLSSSIEEHGEPTINTSERAVEKIGSTATSKEGEGFPVDPAHHCWQSKAQYAHTLPITDIFRKLQVDVEYVTSNPGTGMISDILTEMDSAMPKRHLAFKGMALTRLRQLR